MDVDLEKAYKRFQRPIFWTFHTTFYDFEPGDTPDIRFACLRFYWRDTSNADVTKHTYVGTLNSAFAIPCTKSEAGTLVTEDLSATGSITSSLQERGYQDPSLPHRRSTFSEDAYLECPLDISAALDVMTTTQGFANDMLMLNMTDTIAVSATARNMVDNLTNIYNEFIMAAAIDSSNEVDWPLWSNSFLYYQPHANRPQPESEIEFSLHISSTLTEEKISALQAAGQPLTDPAPNVVGTNLALQPFYSSISDDEEAKCIIPSRPAYIWVSFGQCKNTDEPEKDCPPDQAPPAPTQQVIYLEFLSRSVQPGVPRPQQTPVANCHIRPIELSNLSIIPFYAGPSTVYIGHNPALGATLSNPELWYFEVWLDPDSSIKPSN